jgi:hypothetical protein
LKVCSSGFLRPFQCHCRILLLPKQPILSFFNNEIDSLNFESKEDKKRAVRP